MNESMDGGSLPERSRNAAMAVSLMAERMLDEVQRANPGIYAQAVQLANEGALLEVTFLIDQDRMRVSLAVRDPAGGRRELCSLPLTTGPSRLAH